MTRSRLTFSVIGTVVLLLAGTLLTGCQPPAPSQYVALGDSYTAGPLIPNQIADPLNCWRSDHDYPHLVYPHIVAGNVKVSSFADVSCSGATTADMYNPQSLSPTGSNAPQLNAVTSQAKVVTIGIGGNDIGFSSIVENCALQNPFGAGCTPDYVQNGHDVLRDRIAALAPKIAKLIDDVHSRAPQAQIFIVGYPTILPATGTGCYPIVPLLPSDVPYLRGVEQALNTMLAQQASAHGAHFVDTATSSIGHDVCSATKWVEGVLPTNLAFPVHPNAAGMANTASVVSAAINAAN